MESLRMVEMGYTFSTFHAYSEVGGIGMKNDWLITFRSVTFAQKGERALKGRGINTVLQRTPRNLSERGCGYCLRIRERDIFAAVEILRSDQIAFEKIFAMRAGGGAEERQL